MSGGTTGTPKGVVGMHRGMVVAGLQLQCVASPGDERVDRHDHAAAAALSHLRQHGRAEPRAHQSQSDRADSKSARDPRRAEGDHRGEARVHLHDSDSAQRHHESSDGSRRKGGFQLDQAVLLRRRGVDGGDEEAVRGADRRRDRRGILAHRGADGGDRQSGARREEDRIGRNAAARRPRDASSMPRTASRRCRAAKSGRWCFGRRS